MAKYNTPTKKIRRLCDLPEPEKRHVMRLARRQWMGIPDHRRVARFKYRGMNCHATCTSLGRLIVKHGKTTFASRHGRMW